MIFILTLLVSGCIPTAIEDDQVPNPVSPSTTLISQSNPITIAPLDTPTIESTPISTPSPHAVPFTPLPQLLYPTITPLEDSLGFPLPSPELAISPSPTWRPPLYPVPWAINEHDHFLFVDPFNVDDFNRTDPSYRYGSIDLDPETPHTGVDYDLENGTPILAAGPGTVEQVGHGIYRGVDDTSDPYGLAVVIHHDFGFDGESLYTVYAHLSEALVRIGQHVNSGDLIGLSGDSGDVTGPHLHFEIRTGINFYFNSKNPELWLSPSLGHGVLVGRVTNVWWEWLFDYPVRITSLERDQYYWINTYGTDHTITRDEYYKENLVLSDIPAGLYEIKIGYVGWVYRIGIQIHPGTITYFRFKGSGGFSLDQPPVAIPTLVPALQP
jgi:murein DD-endopeptidase MepM/ murein hydrolase activator NlpD